MQLRYKYIFSSIFLIFSFRETEAQAPHSVTVTYNAQSLVWPNQKVDLGLVFQFENGKTEKTKGFLNGTIPWKKFRIESSFGRVRNGVIHIPEYAGRLDHQVISVSVYDRKNKELITRTSIPYHEVTDIKIVPESRFTKAPGNSFRFTTQIKFDNNGWYQVGHKTSPISLSDIRYWTEGGWQSGDRFDISPDIRDINQHRIELGVAYRKNDDIRHRYVFLLDYINDFSFHYHGQNGLSGGASDFLNGAENGGNGSDGPNLNVYMATYYDDILLDELIYFKIEETNGVLLDEGLCNPKGGSITISSTGGNGGNGGNGRDGHDGEDGADGEYYYVERKEGSEVVREKKQHAGQNGENGDNGLPGANGGNGGNGGNIYVHWSPNTLKYNDLIRIKSLPGSGGASGYGGQGGDRGDGGDGTPHGNPGKDGCDGPNGAKGDIGLEGKVFHLFEPNE